MKATKSRDGALRFTVKTEHRISSSELEAIICYRISQQVEILDDDGKLVIDSENKFTKRGQVFNALRAEIAESGMNRINYWCDHISEKRTAIISNHAKQVVAALFPELVTLPVS